MVAPQILLIASFLSITWGAYLIGTIRLYAQMLRLPTRQRKDVVVALRRVIIAFCVWMFVFSFVFRTAMVLVGFGENTTGQIAFFTLLGTNVVGSIFAIVSLRYD